MKPYIYIVAVLLVGGSFGYFIGQRMGGGTSVPPDSSSKLQSDDRAMIESLLNRQKEAYASHDEFMLLRDCAAGYVEVNGSTGETFDMERAIIHHHAQFKAGKSVTVLFDNLDVSFMQKAALVRATYSKTSDQYEQQGFAGLTGKVLWLLSKEGEQWKIAASAWTEDRKR